MKNSQLSDLPVHSGTVLEKKSIYFKQKRCICGKKNYLRMVDSVMPVVVLGHVVFYKREKHKLGPFDLNTIFNEATRY